MDPNVSSRLLRFFIFNSSYSQREGEEHKKILFYYPPKTDLDEQIKDVGLCEALIKFTGTFSKKDCNALHTQQTRKNFMQVAPEFWMVMTVSIPTVAKTIDGVEVIEYKEDDVQDMICDSILKQSYDMFKLFMGPIECILTRTDVEGLKQRFDHFFNRYVYSISLDQTDIVDVFDGLQFLPLDKATFLRVQCYVNQIESAFQMIKYTAFLYNDCLVWCALEPEDMRIIYRYLTTSLFPAHPELESSSVSTRSQHMGRFIAGPPNLDDPSNLGKIPKLYLSAKSGVPEVCTLVVYRALRASICLFMDASTRVSFDFYNSLDQVLGPELTQIADLIYETVNKPSVIPTNPDIPAFRYIYYNHMNMALKSTMHPDGLRKSGNPNVPTQLLRVVVDLKNEIDKFICSEHTEVVAKTSNEAWVVAKKSDKREVYIVITHKNSNLIEVHDEAKRLCATQFNNIFFLD